MARVYQHPAEYTHDLNLLLLPLFNCKACGFQGSGFCYNCRVCSCNYHTFCLKMPLQEFCASHQHLLKLEFSCPYEDIKGFRCDVCGNPGFDHWLYRCNDCEFDVHINCVYTPINLKNLTSEGSAPPVETRTSYVNLSPSAPYPDFSNTKGETETSTFYANPSPPAPHSNLSNTGSYVLSSGNPNLLGSNGGEEALGTGIAGLLATRVFSGIGEGIGQEIVQGIFNGLGDVGSSTSD
ncbi:hypothetical protein JCGZ_25551 [Jatropha curcas]|uniref:DC1 domain-containing protein n=2 Tax=Jatropha curcas TaxID=180498 RepID=A0A067JXB0_JATCU|nr:hypothetical protein JCGZ_25551 [Jatropha curcas]